MSSEDQFLSLANASGFLFQLGIEHEISRLASVRSSHWEVIAREHRWVDPVSSEESFVDLVLQSDAGRMIVECKRTTDATWLFLVPDGQDEAPRARLLWTHTANEDPPISAWDDFNVRPTSAESAFCVIRGQGEGAVSLLERLSSLQVRATEAISGEELRIGPQRAYGAARIYFPAIITNARLRVGRFSSTDVDLETGKLDKLDSEDVPFVRFRKNLSTGVGARPQVSDISEANRENERTVFVINSSSLESVLPGMEIGRPSVWQGGQWPWVIARQTG